MDIKFLDDMFLKDSSFQTRISKDLYWVPYNTLGPFSNMNKRETLLDSLMFFSKNNFYEYDDTKYYHENGLTWELHRKNEVAFKTNSGCCSSTAGWVCYDLKNKYEEVGMISLFRPNGTGHVFNYIFHENQYYIFDFLPFTKNYDVHFRETGKKVDFINNKQLTSLCYKTSDLNMFSLFFGRIQALKGYSHLFFKIKSHSAPPCACFGDENKIIVYPEDEIITKLEGYKEDNLSMMRHKIDCNPNLFKEFYIGD